MSTALGRLALSIALVAGLLVAGHGLRGWLGIELDVDSLRTMTTRMGPLAPAIFVFIVAGRALLWLPSQVVLIVAGLCFGTGLGALVGGAGLMISGLFLFLLARYAGRDSIERRIGAKGRTLLAFTSRRQGALALALASGYPLSPLSPLQAGAGLTAMPLASFVAAAFVGGTVRASTYAFFGDAMLELEGHQIAGAAVLLVALLLLPFASTGGRRWLSELFARRDEPTPPR
ncbi:MAG: VTT domain-containing protein [Myxococcota bacterium]